jgi:hypothetical protein
MQYTGEHFSNQSVRLDGNQFDGCRFTNVVFEYAGGPVHVCGCRFEGFRWQLDGDLARGLAVLGQLYGESQAAAMTQVARAIFPKTATPTAGEGAPRIHASLAAILDSADEDDAEEQGIEDLPIAYSRLRGAIKRGGFSRAA